MTLVEPSPQTEIVASLPYVIQLSNDLLAFSDLSSVDDLDANQMAALLVDLAKAAEVAKLELGRLALKARDNGVGPHMSSRSTGEYLAHQTRTTPSSAHALIRQAETAQQFGAFYWAQDAGRISSDHIEQLSQVWRKHPSLEDGLLRDEQLLADTAIRLTPWQFGEVLARWVMHMQPDQAADDYAKQEDARYVAMAFDLDNNLHLEAQLDPVCGEGFANLIDRRAQKLFYEDWAIATDENEQRLTPVAASVIPLRRTHAQRRADALVSLVIDGSSTPADAQRPEPLVILSVDEDTIADVVDAAVDGTGSATPGAAAETPFDPDRRCETGRGTAIPPRVLLKHFLVDRIRRVVVDKNGVIINAGRAMRLFSPTQRELLKFRDRSCQFPGCTIPARRCEADHAAFRRWAPKR